MIGHQLAAGEIRAPEDGPVSWLDGITPPLTALEAFTMSDLAVIAPEITGRDTAPSSHRDVGETHHHNRQ